MDGEWLGRGYERGVFLGFLGEWLPDFSARERMVAVEGEAREVFDEMRQLGKSARCGLTILEAKVRAGKRRQKMRMNLMLATVMRRYGMRAALVALDTGEGEWVLSLVVATNGRGGRARKATRWWSYRLGVGAKTVTPQKMLLAKGVIRDIADLRQRFSVEVVNRKFYLAVAERYEELVRSLELPAGSELERREFAVRLIGRLMFCWFLKEKKSEAGEALVPEGLLGAERVRESGEYYREVLEPLFFGCLNTRREERPAGLGTGEFGRVPYLNGGLFSPQKGDYRGGAEVTNEWCEKMFELLGQYDFTVDENMDGDVELAVDPEMLGRVFENLLATMNPETGKTARKATGSFYTPREIVGYIVDKTLVEHLARETEIEAGRLEELVRGGRGEYDATERRRIVGALARVRVLDPACGSGAFPMGMLQKIVVVLQNVDEDGTLMREEWGEGVGRGDYGRKLAVIERCIYGVDIQTIAIEIARLRCFLTLVIEEEVVDAAPNRGVRPLPNLDFKFVTADSLKRLPEEASEEGRERLERVRGEYFVANGERKRRLRRECEEALAEAGVDWRPFENAAAGWCDTGWMLGVEKFDIVIGNPPYLQVKKAEVSREWYPYANRRSRGKQNLYKVFVEHAHRMAKDGGVVGLVVQSSLLGDMSAVGTRELLLKESRLLEVVEFPKQFEGGVAQVFENVVQGTCICIFEKGEAGGEFGLSVGNVAGAEAWTKRVRLAASRVEKMYPEQLYIPLVKSEVELAVLKRLLGMGRMSELIATAQQGDVNLGLNRERVVRGGAGVKIYRGSGFHKYTKVADSGERIAEGVKRERVRQNMEAEFLLGRNISGTTDGERLIFTLAEPGEYLCGDSINKYRLGDARWNRVVLGILNSKLMDWVFRKTSTNNHVNCYEVGMLPVPRELSFADERVREIDRLVGEVLEEMDGEKVERIDELVSRLYGVDGLCWDL